MSLNATVLFDLPQHEIASLLQSKLRSSTRTQIVAGFATPEGMGLLESALCVNPTALHAMVIGAATYQGFEALDRLITCGISQQNLFVHLGHTRVTGASAKHRFYRYHPMLHSKVYYTEHTGGTASAIIGSHNVTGFALAGLNGEAAVMLEGSSESPEFKKIRQHIQTAIAQSIAYLPGMKAAYSWWTHQFIQGLSDKASDFPREGEPKRTIVILAELRSSNFPKKNDVVYFELPLALGTIQSLKAEVHIYLFDRLPSSPTAGLAALHTARASLWCRPCGLEMRKGGVELQANWQISDHRRPFMDPVTPPFRPTPGAEMQQVRVQAYNEVRGKFEYLFELPQTAWEPDIDRETPLLANDEHRRLLAMDYHKANPEDYEWYLVKALRPEGFKHSEYSEALSSMSPEAGSYVLMSLRRRDLSEKDEEP